MRIWVISLLILLFSGISTVPAFSVEQSDTNDIALSSFVRVEAPVLTQSVYSHHDKCCSNSGDKASSAKVSNCAADCTSLVIDNTEFVFQTSIELETTPISVFSTVIVYPKEQPPKFS